MEMMQNTQNTTYIKKIKQENSYSIQLTYATNKESWNISLFDLFSENLL